MKREWFQGANLLGLIVIMALFGWKCTRDEPETAPVAKMAEAPTYSVAELVVTGAADMAEAKNARVLFESVNAPRMRLYDVQASHPACEVNGKRAQVVQVGESGFSCYRWIGNRVAVRMDHDQWAMYPGETFKAR